MKINKKILFSSIGICVGGIAIIPPICVSVISTHKNNNAKEFLKKQYNVFCNTNVLNNEIVKGCDPSSYAETASNFLFSQGIVDETGNPYNCEQFDKITCWDNNTNVTLQKYIDTHLFSYIDENGNRIYDNFFKILKNQVGINSIRLKIWVNPFNENGVGLGGGTNDINTTIYLINQAKAAGINDILLNIHYSDFWGDPGSQWTPKSWRNNDTKGLCNQIRSYTYNVLNQIYIKTGIVCNKVQIGNEINHGLFWKPNSDGTYNDGYKNLPNTIEYIKAGIEGIIDFENYLNTNNPSILSSLVNKKIEKILHFNNAATNKMYECTDLMFTDKFIMDNIDTVGLSYYLFWSPNFEHLIDCINTIKTKYNKNILILEYSAQYTASDSERTFDIHKTELNNNIPCTANGQLILTNLLMQTISKADPSNRVGFYWWEPANLIVGKSTWATIDGIKYKWNYDKTQYSDKKEGNNWWDKGIFDQNGILLPVGKIIKNFERVIDPSNNELLSSYNLKDQINTDIIYENNFSNYYTLLASSLIANNAIININDNNFKRTPLNHSFYTFKNGKKSDYLEIYDLLPEQVTQKIIEEKIINQFQRILWHQVHFENFTFDPSTQKGQIDVVVNSDSFYYCLSNDQNLNISTKMTIYFELKDYCNVSTDLSMNLLTIKSDQTDWTSLLFKHISENVDVGTLIWNTFKYQDNLFSYQYKGGISSDNAGNYSPWIYSDTYKKNRYTDWLLLKSDKIFNSSNLAVDSLVNKNKYEYPTTLSNILKPGENELFFGIKLKINEYSETDNFIEYSTLSEFGTEYWTTYPLLVFKLKVNLI